jgi:hypothetical protein
MKQEETEFDKRRNDFLKELKLNNSNLIEIHDISFENDDIPNFLQKLEVFENISKNVSIIIK